MKTTVKKWAFSLVLLSLMASCGGDNNTAGGGNSNNSEDSRYGDNTSVSSGTAHSDGFIREFEKNGFAGAGLNQDFEYRTISSNHSNCEQKWGFVTICSSSSWGGSSSGYGIREVESNGEVYRNSYMQSYDTFGRNLDEIKSRLLTRMKAANAEGKVLKCLQYSGFPEYCYTRDKWSDIYYDCKETNYNGWHAYTSAGCQQILNQDPRKAKSQKYVFGHDDFDFLVDLNKPLGAQPTAIYASDGNILVHTN